MVEGRVCDSAKSVTASPLRCSAWHSGSPIDTGLPFLHWVNLDSSCDPATTTQVEVWSPYNRTLKPPCNWICSNFLAAERHICANVNLVYPNIIGPAAVHVGRAILAHPCPKKPLAGHRETTSLVETSGAAQTRWSSQSSQKGCRNSLRLLL